MISGRQNLIKRLYYSLGHYKELYVFSAIELCLIIVWSLYSHNGISHADTATYYDAYDVIISGKPDLCRTPLYPFIIGLSRELFGSVVSVALIYILQSLLFLFSIRWMGVILENVTKNRKISYWFTAIYALYPGVLSSCGAIMTESLTISLVTAVLYLVSEAYYHNFYKKAVIAGLLCLILWMQRPALIIVPILLTILWTVLFLTHRKKGYKTWLWGLLSTIFSMGCLVLYSLAFKQAYNKVTISMTSTINNYMAIREAKAIDLETIENPKIKIAVDSFLRTNGTGGSIAIEEMMYRWWSESDYLKENFEFEEYNQFVNNQMKSHLKEMLVLLYNQRFEFLVKDNCVSLGYAGRPLVTTITRIAPVNNGTAIMIFLIGFVLLIRMDIKRKKFSYFIWFLYTLFAANYFSVWVGAPNDYSRLLASNYPVLIAVSCWLLNQLAKRLYCKRTDKYLV